MIYAGIYQILVHDKEHVRFFAGDQLSTPYRKGLLSWGLTPERPHKKIVRDLHGLWFSK